MNRLHQNHQKINWVTVLLYARLHQIAIRYLHQFWSVFLVKWGVKIYLRQRKKMMLILIYHKEEACRAPIFSARKKKIPMVIGRKNQIVEAATYLGQKRWVVIQEVIIYLGRGDLMHRGLIEVICSEQNKMDSTGRSFIPYQIKHVCSQFFRYITQLSIPICSQTTVCTHYIYSIAKKLHSIKRKRKEIWSSYSLSLHIWFLTSFMEMIKKLLNIIWLFSHFSD